MRKRTLATALLCGALLMGGCKKATPEAPQEQEPNPEQPVEVTFFADNTRWIAYAPTNFNPETEQYPSEESIRQDLQVLKRANFEGLVTYASDGTLSDIPRLARAEGMQHVVMGIWDPKNRTEFNNAVAAKDDVDGYCLGNEGLNVRYTLEELTTCMDELRTTTHKPITTTETLSSYPTVMDVVDWIFPNTHPYWAGITDPTAAAAWTVQQYNGISSTKPVVFKEVGLPSAGCQECSEEHQNAYYRLLEQQPVRYVHFEAFDQPWKDEVSVEPHWGIFTSSRSPKQAAEPHVYYTFVPPRGSSQNLEGRVVNVRPSDYRTVTYIRVGSWWVKPYLAWPLTTIRSDGSWITDITTGGIDETADELHTYVVPPTYAADLHALPTAADYIAMTSVTR